MLRFHIRQNLRSAFFLAVLAVVLAVPVTLWQLNRNGLPDSWRAFIEQELANQGIHLQIGAIRYLPLQGITASNVRIFADPQHQYELSEIRKILLDFDKTKLARGTVHLNKIQLINASVLIHADNTDPESETLELTGVNGTLLMSGGRVLEVRDASGQVGDIDVTVNARLLGFRSEGTGGLPHQDATQRGKRREFIATLSKELERWTFPGNQRPQLQIQINGDLNELSSISSTFSLQAPSMALHNHALQNVKALGSMKGLFLSIESLTAEDNRGTLNARAEYDILERSGRFDIDSSIDQVRLARAWLALELPNQVMLGGKQSITAAGNFHIPTDTALPVIHAVGSINFESVMVRGVVFDQVRSDFAFRDREILLRDAHLDRTDGAAWGKAHIQWPMIRLTLETTFPIQTYKPLFAGQPLQQVID